MSSKKIHGAQTSPPVFYYIRNNGMLLSGAARSFHIGKAVTWRKGREYDWARRFLSVDAAIKYGIEYGVYGAEIVDRAGRVVGDVPTMKEVQEREG